MLNSSWLWVIWPEDSVLCSLDPGPRPGPTPEAPGAVCGVRSTGEPRAWSLALAPQPGLPPHGSVSLHPGPLTRQVQRKWRALRPPSQASVQKRVCRSRHRSSTAQR